MLVLTRKSREQIQIGENVVITILRVKGQAVRIGIEAPRDVRVLRSELPKNEEEVDAETEEPPAPETDRLLTGVVASDTVTTASDTVTTVTETVLAHTPMRGAK